MGKKFSIVSVIVILFSISFTIILTNCGKDKVTKETVKAWEAYVEAIRAGKGETAKSFFTKESQKYFEFDSLLQKSFMDSKYTTIRVEHNPGFIELQVLAEKDSKQTGLYEYLVKQNNKYYLQYPFLIFAKDWPIKKTEHFIIHSESFSPDALHDSTEDSLTLDPIVLEEFYSKIENLIGVEYSKHIDYYFCESREEEEKLTGRRGALWTSIGSAVISTNRYDFAEITYILIRTNQRPVDLLYYGIAGYAELQRCRVEKVYWDNIDYTNAKYFKKLGDHPLFSLLQVNDTIVESERQRCSFLVGGALVDYLIGKYGIEKFRILYQNSPTPQEFKKQISILYDTSLESIENTLNEKYKKYFSGRATQLNERR